MSHSLFAPLGIAAPVPKTLRKLNPCVLDGILRVGDRIEGADVDFKLRHPANLPAKSHFGLLVVGHCHEIVGHSGIRHTCSALRKCYWIQNYSSAIRGVLKNCSICKRLVSSPEKQIMAGLPSARLQIGQPPFFHTGVDCFGPFLVKQGRSRVKKWIFLLLYDHMSCPRLKFCPAFRVFV